ncbi:hypothetical protein SAY87_002031 [Trapa incisa]|uniref:RING-type domain-containing protein n=1 Tax=Trapa incisa TaxID=236973 RepID=A0AAN7JW38_9MYRT|nr:hypothetical protein SAY87_002031 [Trapa incisa]
MGNKRGRTRTDYRPEDEGGPSTSSAFPEAIPCSSGVESSQKKKASSLVDSKELKPPPFWKEKTDHSGKQHSGHFSLQRHNQHHPKNLGRPIYVKRPRHYYGHRHHSRNPGTNFQASSSHGKLSPWDQKLSFKVPGSDYGQYTEDREKAFTLPEIIIQSNSTDNNSGFPDPEKIPCGICHNLRKRRPMLAPFSGEHDVVAVLVCGHLYHADCLEQKTPPQEKFDPPCPICLGPSFPADNAGIELD